MELDDLKNKDHIVDYYDGNIAIIDNISDLTNVAPLYAKINFIVICTKGRIQFDINDTPLILKEAQILLSAPYVILDNYLFSSDFECKILCLSDDVIHAMLGEDVKHRPVDEYASELNITPKYLTMLCTRVSGRPASEWIAQYTKEDIRYCLFHTDLSVKEIAAKLGFPNISFFGSYVRRQFGMSPTQLRCKDIDSVEC